MAETTFDPTSLGAVAVDDFDPTSLGAEPVQDFDPTSLGAVPVSEEEDPFITAFKDKKPKPDTFADDWTGFVANMQIAGNRLLQSVTAGRLDLIAQTQKSAQLARRAAETGSPEDFDAYAQDRIQELGMAAFPKRDSASISKDAEVLENRWRNESLKIPEFASYLAEKEQRIKELTPSLSPEMQKFNEAKGAEFWKVFAENPVEGLANVIASSAVISSPSIAMGAIGSLAGPAGTAAGTGAGSYYVESANAMLDSLQAAGVDLSNKEQVEAAFTDPAVMEKARDFANKRGIPVAIFDAASAGIAGKFIGPLLKEGATATTKQVLAATGKEVLSQMGAGAIGEAAAELVSGQELSGKEIALEALGEIGSAITEGYSNVKARQRIDAELAKTGTTEPPSPPAPEPTLTQVPPVVQEDIYTAPPEGEGDVFAGITKGGEPSAAQEPETTEVLRDVPKQPVKGEGTVPAKESTERVPPSTEERPEASEVIALGNKLAESDIAAEQEGRRATPEEREQRKKFSKSLRASVNKGDTIEVEEETIDKTGTKGTKIVRYKVYEEEGRLIAYEVDESGKDIEGGRIFGLEENSSVPFHNALLSSVESGVILGKKLLGIKGQNKEGSSEFIGTSINTPEGPITGKEAGSSHNTMTTEAVEKGTPWEALGESTDPNAPPSALGFAFRKPDGSIEWVDRVEAGRRLTEMGLLKGLKPGTKLTSEHLRGEVEGVTFTPAAKKPAPLGIEVEFDSETLDATEDLRDRFDSKRRAAMVFRFPKDKPQILYRGISENELKAIQANPDADIMGGKYSVPLEREYGAQYAATPEEAMRAAFHDEKQKGVEGQKKYIIKIDARGKLASHLDPRTTTTPQLSEKMRMVIPSERVSGNLGVSVKVPFKDVISVQEIVREGKGFKVKEETSKAAKMTENEAANAIYKYKDAAIALAKRKGATDLNAEDIFQKVVLDLTPKLASGELKPTSIAGLVNQGVAFATSKEIKPTVKGGEGITVSGDIEGPTGETAITEAATTRGPRAESVSQEDIQTIEQAIESLPESERKVMKMTVEGLSDEEISKQTGLTPNAVRQARFRSREKLKEFIRSQGIGERMAPGAANEKEFQRARYIAGTDIYLGLESAGQLTRETWERNMERIYEDAFTPEQLDDAWRVVQIAAQEAKETRKPVTSVISQMMGVEKGREGITALKNAQADKERRERGLPAAFDSARRTQPSVWDEAMRENDETNGRAEEAVIDKLRADFRATLNDKELFHLLHAKIDAENRYDEAVEQVNEAQTEQDRLVAMGKARKAESDFQELLDLAKQVGSEQGRAFAARKFLVSRDYSPLTLTAELQAAQFGEELTDEQKELVTKVSEKVNETQSQFDAREEQLEQEESDKALAEKFREFQKQPVLDSRILAIANKIVAKLDAAADRARERLKGKLFTLNAGIPNPTIIADLVIIGSSKIAHGLRDLAWKISMRNEFGEGINPYLDDIYKQSDQAIDNLEEQVPEADRPKVRNVVRKTGSKDILQDTEQKIKARVEDGESLSDLRSYVQKMALALVRSGVDSAQALVDAVHPILQKYQPTITKRQAADLISGYGDFRALDKEESKTQLRDFKTQLQQLSKLEDIAARKPLSKTGIERQVPSDLARRLIREVNELKRKIGVVVTDPTKQLKSAMDAIKTNLKNQIRDLTHQIETGEKPIPGTPTPTDAEIDALKATRDRVKKTLAEIEGKPEQTMEQRVKAAESAMERSIKELETRIKNKDIGPTKNAKVRSDRLDALRAQRESLSAELEALRAADQDLQDTKTFDRLMKTASELEGKLSRGEVAPKTKAAKIEDELVTQARERVNELRRQMSEARAKTSEAQQKKLDSTIAAVERSIASYDARLKTGAVSATKKGPSISSPLLERLKAERDAMRRLVEQLRKAPPLSPEQLAIKNLKARIARQNAELQDRIARGDFATRKRKTIDYSKDPEAVRIMAENTKWRREFEKAKYEAELKGHSAMRKLYNATVQTLNTAKASVGSVDLSAFGRQAGPATLSHPIVAFKNLILSIQAMNERRMNELKASIELRPNAKNGYYRIAKPAFTELEGPLAKREETFRSDWAKHIPWIKWSNRQFTTFLNLMRADLLDMMIQAGPVNPTPEQLRAFGRAVNILTGRGEFGKFEGATDLLAIPFWSPRLYLSRLQTMAAFPIWQKDARGVRKVIANEYMRMVASGTVIALLGLLAGARIEWEEEGSSDYFKLRFGDVRIDPWAGHQQWLVFLRRILTGDYVTTKGKKFDLDYPNNRPGPYDPTYGDTAARMFRSKLNPIAQGIWEFQTGRDINGDPVSKTEAVAGSVLPLSIFNDDIVPIAEDYGLDKAAAAEAINMIGWGVQHYGKDKKN